MQRHRSWPLRGHHRGTESEKGDGFDHDRAYSATHDLVTGLPNRFLLLDRLDQSQARAQRWGRISAVLTIDVDPGTVDSDDRLRDFAAQTLARLRPSDTLARLEPHRFVVVSDVYGAHEAQTIANRIATKPTEPGAPVEFDDAISIGITIVTEPNQDLDEIIARAERWIGSAEPSQTSNIVIAERQQEVIDMTSRIPLNGAHALRHRPDDDGAGAARIAEADLDTGTTSVRRTRLAHASSPSAEHDDEIIDLTDEPKPHPFRIEVSPDQRIIQLERLGWGPLRPTVDLVSASGPTCIGISGHVPAIAARPAAQQLLGAAFRVKPGALPFSANVSAAIVVPFLAELALEATAAELTANAVGIEIEAHTVRLLDFSAIEHLRALRQEGVAITIRRLDASSAHDSFMEAAAARVITIGVAGMSRERLAQLVAIASRANVAVIAEGVDTRDDLTIVTRAGCRYAQGALFTFAPSHAGVANRAS